MTSGSDPVARSILLLLEDNDADADIVRGHLTGEGESQFDVVQVSLMEDAARILSDSDVDIILLDLMLPDSKSEESVKRLRQIAGETPIVVMTGVDDENLVLRCIQAGAQDYLLKNEIDAATLRRAIDYALARKRESERRALRLAIARYRRLTSASSVTSLTARSAGIGSLRERMPYEFRACLQQYQILLRAYVAADSDPDGALRNSMHVLVTRLGDDGATPRDMIDLHTRVLEELGVAFSARQQQSIVVESRLFALELMGLLVEYYRVGRRYYQSGEGL